MLRTAFGAVGGLVLASLVVSGCGELMMGELEPDAFMSTPAGDEAGLTTTLAPAADTYVRSGSFADRNFGAATSLLSDLDDGKTQEYVYLRFNVPSFTSVSSARLKLYVTNGSTSAPDLVSVTSTTWGESALTWNTKPATGALVTSLGSVPVNTWIDVDVKSLVQSGKVLSLALVPKSGDGLLVNSKEAASNRPQLVLVTTACGDGTCNGGETCSSCASDCTCGSTPYGATPVALPGTIEPAFFDKGGEGIAYHDTTAGNLGDATFRNPTDVDIKQNGGSNVLGWLASGEWLNYSVNVTRAGTYTVKLRAASGDVDGAAVHFEVGTTNLSGPITLTSTGSYTTWATVQGSMSLLAGPQILRLVIDQGWFDLDSIELTTATTTPSNLITIVPGESIQTKVSNYPAGTGFLLKAGVHRRQQVKPKDGNQFIGEPGAIMDGENVTLYAFETISHMPKNVVIRGLIIEHYAPNAAQSAIQGDNGIDWVIEDNEVRYNLYSGIRATRGSLVRGNWVHHNSMIGIACWKCSGAVIEDNEVNNNPPAAIAEAGATAAASNMKLFKADPLTVRNNYVHDGPHKGIWLDTDNRNVLIEGNTVLRHGQAGIWHENGYDAVIRNNTVTTCGTRGFGWIDGAGINMTNSPNVQIYGNTISGCANGIGVMQASGYPSDGPAGTKLVQNLYVHDNTVTMQSGRTGLVQNMGDNTFFTSKNNRFAHNTYNLGPNAAYFAWMNQNLNETQWKSYGQDTTGTFNR
jgi:parallel beta-helix repeat protein